MKKNNTIKIPSIDSNLYIAVIGLGYVGLPLALAFAEKYKVIGFDLISKRINELKSKVDRNCEIDKNELDNKNIKFTANEKDLENVNIFIVTVPTPVDKNNKPDFTCLIDATKLVSKYISKNGYVIYESTVYPGATEEICVPIISEISKLNFNTDFFVGYSPERVNPGDKTKTLKDIIKLTSGSSPEAANFVDELYSSIISAGTFKVKSIKLAEAAKLIENIQRDVNIALVNELSKIFFRLGIDTNEVITASSTKWNFQKYYPGLVGGHCIGVDPYYMSFLCEKLKYEPKLIASGREINDSMAKDLAIRIYDLLNKKLKNNSYIVLVIGLTFKENCNDIRNSKVFDLVKSLNNFGCKVDVIDENVDQEFINKEHELNLIRNPKLNYYDGVVLAVPHNIYVDKGVNFIRSFGKKEHLFFDLKGVFKIEESDLRM